MEICEPLTTFPHIRKHLWFLLNHICSIFWHHYTWRNLSAIHMEYWALGIVWLWDSTATLRIETANWSNEKRKVGQLGGNVHVCDVLSGNRLFNLSPGGRVDLASNIVLVPVHLEAQEELVWCGGFWVFCRQCVFLWGLEAAKRRATWDGTHSSYTSF